MYELDAMIDDEPYTILYNHTKVDNYLGEWLDYAEVLNVLDKDGNNVSVNDDYTFFSKCEKVANEILQEWLEDEYDDNF